MRRAPTAAAPPRPAPRERSRPASWRDLAIALSFANLCYFRVWSELLTYTKVNAYTMASVPPRAAYAAVMANVLLAGVLLWVAMTLARRSAVTGNVARWTFFLLLILPANGVRSVLANEHKILRSALFGVIGTRGVAALAVAGAIVVLVLLWRSPQRLPRLAARLLLLLSPLVAMTFAQAAWRLARSNNSAFLDHPHAAPLRAPRTSPRVLWVIFDEWDERLTFTDRPGQIRLPELDQFRSRSLHAANAYSPGPETMFSMPALITGRMVAEVVKNGPNQLLINFAGEKGFQSWSSQRNIFAEARAAGFNTAIVGWYHPYCRVLSSSLSDCVWWPMSQQHNSMGGTFFEILPNQTRSLFETQLISPFGRSLPTIEHARVIREMLDRARQEVSRRDLGLTLLHIPVPHSPHTFNRRTGRFDLGDAPIQGYIDSLVLTDRALGDLRRAMQSAGTWDGTTILLSSDHSFRASEALDGKKDHRVPFLLKMAGHSEGLDFATPFNTVLTHDLLLTILRGQVATVEQAAAWLDQHRTIADSPYNYN